MVNKNYKNPIISHNQNQKSGISIYYRILKFSFTTKLKKKNTKIENVNINLITLTGCLAAAAAAAAAALIPALGYIVFFRPKQTKNILTNPYQYNLFLIIPRQAGKSFAARCNLKKPTSTTTITINPSYRETHASTFARTITKSLKI